MPLTGNTKMFSDNFLEYIMRNENDRLRVSGTGMRHSSVEGGTDTVGFGHKLTKAEEASGKIYGMDIDSLTPEDAKQIMLMDLSVHQERAKKQLEEFQKNKKVSNARKWEDLSPREKEILTDYSYNGVLDQFPKFTDALVRNDQDEMRKQYKRYTDGTPLTGRNNDFFDLYLATPEERASRMSTREDELEYALGTALDPQRASAVMGDVTSGYYDVNPAEAVDGWDVVGDAIRKVRGVFGIEDPKPIRYYEVREGDTLSTIAKRLGTTVNQLVEDNNITDPNKIKAGQPLEF